MLPTNIHSTFPLLNLLVPVLPIIILSLGLESIIDALLTPVTTLIAALFFTFPEISIADEWASNIWLAEVVPPTVSVPINPPTMICLSV